MPFIKEMSIRNRCNKNNCTKDKYCCYRKWCPPQDNCQDGCQFNNLSYMAGQQNCVRNNLRKQYITSAAGLSRGYSDGVVVDDLSSGIRTVYLAGFVDPNAASHPTDIALQTIGVFGEMRRVLNIAGGQLSDLTQVEVVLTDNNAVNSKIFNDTRVAILGSGPYPGSMKLGGLLAPNGIAQVEVQGVAVYNIPVNWQIINTA